MSRGLKLKYDEMRANSSTKKLPGEEENENSFNAVKNVCFVQPDGSRMFLNYGYMVSGEYSPQNNTITLGFTSHIVTLSGTDLENLFYELMFHIPKQIECANQRYSTLNENDKIHITKIEIQINI